MFYTALQDLQYILGCMCGMMEDELTNKGRQDIDFQKQNK